MRSGLVSKHRLFSENESADIYRCVDFAKANCETLTYEQEGELYPTQSEAAAAMLRHDTGILCAATAFGKTAVGAYLIAKRKVNTLVLVHNVEIMKTWVEGFVKFLQIDEEPPEYSTPKGRRKSAKALSARCMAVTTP